MPRFKSCKNSLACGELVSVLPEQELASQEYESDKRLPIHIGEFTIPFRSLLRTRIHL